MLFVDLFSGNSIALGHIDMCFQGGPGIDDQCSQIGGMGLLNIPAGCEDMICWEFYIGYCIEADVPANPLTPYPYDTTANVDPKVSFLTWRYGIQHYQTNFDFVGLAAVQALVWAWESDVNTSSQAFSGLNAPYNDPLNWNGLVTNADAGAKPWSDGSADNTLLFGTGAAQFNGTEAELYAAVNQRIYDLAVEATAKAGPWVLSQNTEATGVVLSGSAGPIVGEEITFDVGGPVTTDANGFAAWPVGATSSSRTGPGDSFFSPSDNADGTSNQDIMLTFGSDLVAVRTDPPPPTTTTTTTAPPTTTTTPPATTTTTTAPPATTTTTTAPPATTTTTTPPTTTTTPPATTTTTTPPTTTTTPPATTTVPPATTTTVETPLATDDDTPIYTG